MTTVCIPVNSKHFKKTKLFEPYRLSLGRKYFANDVYDSLSHPMLRQSSPKNITCHFNYSQKTIAERLLNISRIRGGTYFKYTDIQYSTVDKLISKTKISHYCTEKCDLSFQLTYHMISVHVSAPFKKTFHYGINQGKNVDVQRSTVCKKYP